jgi:hypothetical protein
MERKREKCCVSATADRCSCAFYEILPVLKVDEIYMDRMITYTDNS